MKVAPGIVWQMSNWLDESLLEHPVNNILNERILEELNISSLALKLSAILSKFSLKPLDLKPHCGLSAVPPCLLHSFHS